MSSIIPRMKLSRTLAFCSLLALAACGGGGSGGGSTGPGPAPNPPPAPDPTPQVLGLAANYTDIVEGDTLGNAFWAAGSGTGAPIDGVNCMVNENYHIHAQLSIYRDGTRLALPAKLGTNGCTYELHTHDATGVVHVETNAQKKFTLGQFFSVWGQPLGASNVAGLNGTVRIYLVENEKVTPYTGNPADIELAEHREVAIVIGTLPAALAKHRWPKSL